MSNLHKDLTDAQIHVPKGFVTAANDTKLTKDSTGALAWVADSGGGGNNFISQNIKTYGSISSGNEFGLGVAQYNSEHKFVTDLGSALITTISPKFMTQTLIYTNPLSGSTLKNWNGWIYGANGQSVTLRLLRATLQCPLTGAYPSTIPVCRAATTTFVLTGNNTPACFNISAFITCSGFTEALEPNEALILTAVCASGESATFHLNCNVTLGF